MPTIGVVIHETLRDQILHPDDRARLEALGDVRWHAGTEKASTSDAIALLHGCDIGVGSWGTPHPGSAGLLAACPDLRLWVHAAGTTKAMFGPHLAGRDLTIASCKTAIADCVAEMTLGEIIIGQRGIIPNAQANRANAGGKRGYKGVLAGATVGVIAASEVGKRVVRLLQPFGCRVLLYDPVISADAAIALGAEPVADLLDLCRRSDAVTLHTPYLQATHHLLRAEHFQAMPDDAVFINTARGACIDEAALITELERGRLFAFLDVTDPEPCAPDSPLRRLDNVIVTSHIAGPRSFNIGAQVVDDIAAFLAGGQPRAVITEAMLATTA